MESKIRIYKILPVAEGLKNWGQLHEDLMAEVASDGVEVTQVELPEVPITSISGNYEADLVATAHTQAALRAEREGFDAVIMGCLLEPGVSAAKEALRIPVVSDAGAALHLASLVARKFSFLLPGVKQGGEDRSLADIVRQYGFADHVVSIRRVGGTSLAFTGAETQDDMVETMLREARAAVREDGAQAVVGYGGLPIIQELRQRLPVPVISAIQASVVVAEMLVRTRLSQSKLAFVRPKILDCDGSL